jgi:toxin HigB-1
MIASFGNETAERIWNGENSKKILLPAAIHELARRKLRMIYAAPSINALRIPPKNHLEKLKGKRKGQWSIRINDQYRVCFKWIEGNAHDVEITDYH